MKTNFAVAAKTTLLLGTLFAVTVPALAVPITGTFGTAALGVVGYLNGGVPVIDFCPKEAAAPGGCAVGGTGTGSFIAGNGTGNFSLLPLGSPGTIKDIGVSAVGNYTAFPVGVPGQTINNFLTLSAFPNLNFQANEFVLQTGCGATQTCIAGFRLSENSGGTVTVSFDIKGTIFDSTPGGFTPTRFLYTLSGSFTEPSSALLAARSLTTTGVFSPAWEGSFITAGEVPEPATVTMFGIAAAAMLLGRLRSKGGSRS